MSQPWYLVADVGGTNARFAAFHGAAQKDLLVVDTKQGGDLLATARDFSQTFPEPPKYTVVAAAGPVSDNAVQLTNANQYLCADDLKLATGAQQAHIINDFNAAAWSTRATQASDLLVLAGDPVPKPGTHLVVGPGTGLGVGALIYDNGTYHSAPGEGGHVGISPRTVEEVAVFEALRTIWPEIFYGDTLVIEAEGILSGTGLPNLYHAVQMVEGNTVTPIDSKEIFAQAKAQSDPVATKTLSIFKEHLAQVSGDLALAFGANGGVFFVGGVALKNPWLFDDDFIRHFREGGRFTKVRNRLNLYLLNRTDFGLLGAHSFARALDT